MSLLHATLAAAGIACIAIPIIIHLLMHRRRKPVMWGAMRFLLEAYRRQRRRLMLEKWLLLACRCLLIALLALAIGRPFVGRLLGAGAGRTLYLLIDNSLTSGLRAADGTTALEHHKAAAKAAIEALRTARIGGTPGSEGDRVALIALGGPAEPVVMPPSADLAAVARLIDDLRPTDSRADIPGALQMVADALAGASAPSAAPDGGSTPAPARADHSRTYVALFSDFRDGSLDLSPGGGAAQGGTSIAAKLPAGVTLLATAPAADERTNTAITGVEPLRTVVVSGGRAGGESEAGEGNSLVRILLRRHGESLAPATTTVQTRVVWPSAGAPAPSGATQEAPTRTTVRWAQGQDSAMVVASLPRGPAGSVRPTGATGAGAGAIMASIDDDPLAGDNSWRRPVEFREALRVGIIAPTRFSTGVSADRLDPGTWARLALAPTGEGAGGIEVVDIEPASIDAARLAGLDAVVLPRPDLIQDSGWARIGLFATSGGVVLVTPPPDTRVHLWPDAMVRGLGLSAEWTLGREPRSAGDGRLVAVAPSTPSGAPANPDQSGIASGLLALVAGELDTLLRPVNVKTVLPIDNTADTGRVILRLENGPPVLWAGRPGEAAGRAEASRTEPHDTRGLIVYLGVALSLDWSDLPAKPLMVPLMQEIVRQGVGQARGSWWMIAGSRPLTPSGAVELRPIDERPPEAADPGSRTPDTGEPGRGPDARGVVSLTSPESAGPLRRAGVFAAIDDRGGTRALIAVNPDPRAGRVTPQPQESVGRLLAGALTARSGGPDAGAGSIVWLPSDGRLDPAAGVSGSDVQRVMAGLFGDSEKGTPVDLPLLIAALALALVEIGLARWASHAEVFPAAVRQAAGAVTAGVIGESVATGDAA